MAGHLLAFEDLAGVLTLTGRAVRTVADRHTVRGAQTTEVVAFHGTGKTFTDRSAADVHELTFEVVVRGDLFTHFDHRLGRHAELRDLALGLDLGGGEMAAHGFRGPLRLGRTCPQCTAA